ncbi:MAG: nucleotidyltransferase family protein [Ardenticatenaceae bacterium]
MPTILELTPEERAHYIRQARDRPGPPPLTASQQQKRERLLARAHEAAAELRHRFGVKRVILFGSLAHTAWFASDSDVDIAVEGLSGGDFWEAWRVVERIIEERQVDLVEFEYATPALRRAIKRHGIEL